MSPFTPGAPATTQRGRRPARSCTVTTADRTSSRSRFPGLVKVDGLDLHVADLDAIDGTPVYDVAPYFKAMGPRGEVREPSRPSEMLSDYWS